MRLEPYLRTDLTIAGLDAVGLASAFQSIAAHLEEKGAVSSAAELGKLLLAREASHTTVLRGGLAVPHTTLLGLTKPMLVVVTTARPVPIGPEGSDPVRVFFVLLSPPDSESEHIRILARICRLALHPGFVDDLHEAPDAETAMAVIKAADRGRGNS